MGTSLPTAAPAKSKYAVSLAANAATCDEDADVRRAALESLALLCSPEGRSRTRAAVSAVCQCLEDQDSEVQLVARQTLRCIGNGRRCSLDSVVVRLGHPDQRVRDAAVAAFADVVSPHAHLWQRAFQRASVFLKHEDAGVRASAALALDGIEDPSTKIFAEAAAKVLERYRSRCDIPEPPAPAPVEAVPEALPKAQPRSGAQGSTKKLRFAETRAAASARRNNALPGGVTAAGRPRRGPFAKAEQSPLVSLPEAEAPTAQATKVHEFSESETDRDTEDESEGSMDE